MEDCACDQREHSYTVRGGGAAAGADDRFLNELVARAQAEGLQLTGEGGLLQQLTKQLLESALEGDMTDHLGYDRRDPAGKNGGNSKNAETLQDRRHGRGAGRDRRAARPPRVRCPRGCYIESSRLGRL